MLRHRPPSAEQRQHRRHSGHNGADRGIWMASFGSTLVLTLLLAIGLVFFLRAASKDRTTVVDVHSPRHPVDVLEGLVAWLQARGWKPTAKDPQRQVLRFTGEVRASLPLSILLSLLASLGAGSLALVLHQLLPQLGLLVWALPLLGPLAGWLYWRRASRSEILELRLLQDPDNGGSALRLRAHRDELIAMETELGPALGLASDGRLLSSPI